MPGRHRKPFGFTAPCDPPRVQHDPYRVRHDRFVEIRCKLCYEIQVVPSSMKDAA